MLTFFYFLSINKVTSRAIYIICAICVVLLWETYIVNAFPTMYPPQAVRQVVLAVDCLVARCDVAEVAGLLHAIWWREGLEGEEAVVAVHLRWYICQRQQRFQKGKSNKTDTRSKKGVTLNRLV